MNFPTLVPIPLLLDSSKIIMAVETKRICAEKTDGEAYVSLPRRIIWAFLELACYELVSPTP